MLAIEIDGSSHDWRGESDLERQERLETLGVRFLRFDDLEIKRDLHDVPDVIEAWIEMAETPRSG